MSLIDSNRRPSRACTLPRAPLSFLAIAFAVWAVACSSDATSPQTGDGASQDTAVDNTGTDAGGSPDAAVGDAGTDAGPDDAGDAHPDADAPLDDAGDAHPDADAPLDDAPNGRRPRCVAYYDEQTATQAPNAADWCQDGAVMTWQSADWPSEVELFYHCEGDPSAPAVYLQHGWPTSSFDFQELSAALSSDFFVCALDTPGYGFSDKPDGYPYSILEDGEIIQAFIEDVMEVDEVLLLTHDKGDSVGLELLHRYVNGSANFLLTGHVMLNGGIHLDQAELSPFQTTLLDIEQGPRLAAQLNGSVLAQALSRTVYSPSLDETGIADLASVLDFDDGTDRLHQTIQYLSERSVYEDDRWLAALAESRVPTTLVWGELDPVAVPAVADYVWDEVLASRPAPADYWRLPCGNHYVQNDRPQEVLAIIRGEPLPAHQDSRCEMTYLFRMTDGGR